MFHNGKTPDDTLFRYLSMKYASKNPLMSNGSACPEDNFKDGITNGAEWYELTGWYFKHLTNVIYLILCAPKFLFFLGFHDFCV